MSFSRAELKKQLTDLTRESLDADSSLKRLTGPGAPLVVAAVIASARQRSSDVHARIEQVKRELARLDDNDANAARIEEQRQEETSREEAAFWFRRFFTSLAIGNGGAFAAITAGLLQSPDLIRSARVAALPIALFGAGLIAAGSVPASLWARSRFRKLSQMWSAVAFGAAAVSAALFCMAVIAGTVGVFLLVSASSRQAKVPPCSVASRRPAAQEARSAPALTRPARGG